VRVDDFVDTGYDIPIFYDNMISKLIVWAETRAEAIELMKQSIKDYTIKGLATTLPFGEFVMNHPNFISGDFDTQFVQKHFSVDHVKEASSAEAQAAALLAIQLLNSSDKPVVSQTDRDSDWYTTRK
jgi:acetyl/propionyl-CoA carboxylase alpha subunit